MACSVQYRDVICIWPKKKFIKPFPRWCVIPNAECANHGWSMHWQMARLGFKNDTAIFKIIKALYIKNLFQFSVQQTTKTWQFAQGRRGTVHCIKFPQPTGSVVWAFSWWAYKYYFFRIDALMTNFVLVFFFSCFFVFDRKRN